MNFSIEFLILIFPLIGVLINGLGGKKLPRTLVAVVACGSVFLSFLISANAFLTLLKLPVEERHLERVLFNWITSGNLKLDFAILIDPLSSLMTLIVTFVGFLIHIYSVGYMAEEEDFSKYFTYLNLFIFSMLILVLGANFALLFVGWELVGLCSYLLIGFWYHKKSAADAAKKAFIVNRVGDFGFILGVSLIFLTFGSLNFSEVFTLASKLHPGNLAITLITLFLFVGATGKSAQIPLYVWLPDAMEGPTPVSALIHAATMVTAGVYMIVRSNALYVLAPVTLGIVAAVGVLTAFIAATIALAQNDIKKILAYSTISQLGYMFLGCGVGAFSSAMFHLTTHAFFKALLFLGSGSVIHAVHTQDIFCMGNLRKYLKGTFIVFLIGGLALAGLPPFAGFFSKDEILAETFNRGHYFLYVLGIITALLTAFYIFRLIYLVFYGKEKISEKTKEHIHEVKIMLYPLVVLAILSVLGGALLGMPFFPKLQLIKNFLEPVLSNQHLEEHPAVLKEIILLVFSFAIALGGILFAFKSYLKDLTIPAKIKQKIFPLYLILKMKYFVDEIYILIFVTKGKKLCNFFWNKIDENIIDKTVNGIGAITKFSGTISAYMQTGYARNYALFMVLGAVFVIAYLFVR